MFRQPDWVGKEFPEEFFKLDNPHHCVLWACDDPEEFVLWRTGGQFAACDLLEIAVNCPAKYTDFATRIKTHVILSALRIGKIEPADFVMNGDPFFSMGSFLVRNRNAIQRDATTTAFWASETLLDKSGEGPLSEIEKLVLKSSQLIVAKERELAIGFKQTYDSVRSSRT